MIIKILNLKNYRNYQQTNVEFDPNVNLIVGDNGVGKTNILEAIHLLSSAKSYRAKYDSDLINYDKEFALVEATITSNDQKDTDNLQIQIARTDRSPNTSTKKVKINNVAKSQSKFTHHLKTVLFSPEDIDIITGSPSQRRKYLDLVLYQVDQKYKKCTTDYTKAIRRRNKILELINETGSGADQLPYYNSKILKLGEYIQQKREELITYFNNFFTSSQNPYAIYATDLKVTYDKNAIDTKRLKDYKQKEIAAKNTLIGPHRDDFIIYQKNKDMAQFASRGEQRTAMFLLKLAEFYYIYSLLEIKPVLLLDDIFSELDTDHKEAILTFINNQQTLITTSTAADIPKIHISKTINLPL